MLYWKLTILEPPKPSHKNFGTLRWSQKIKSVLDDREHDGSNRFYTLQGSTILPTWHEDHATHAGDRPAQGGTHDDLSQMRSNQLSGARECWDSPSPRPDTPGAASLTLNSTDHPAQPTHTTGKREQRIGGTQVIGLPPYKTACG